MNDPWPSLPLEEWKDTYATLHRWTQIVGKIRLALSPWINHSWHVTLYVTARGLTTSPIWHGTRTFQIDFGFIGKCSPVHFFWGSFDLAVTRFSGRRAPEHPGGVPHLPDAVTREAYSHEVSSCGFWPGGGPVPFPAYYSYAYPTPDGFGAAPVRPSAAFFSRDLGEFVLPYDEVRRTAAPDAMLLEFLQSTYEAAAELGRWDRAALERQAAGA